MTSDAYGQLTIRSSLIGQLPNSRRIRTVNVCQTQCVKTQARKKSKNRSQQVGMRDQTTRARIERKNHENSMAETKEVCLKYNPCASTCAFFMYAFII